jgi:hypothetical protein
MNMQASASRVGEGRGQPGQQFGNLRCQPAERPVEWRPQLGVSAEVADPPQGVQRLDHGVAGGVVGLWLHLDRADEQPVRGVDVTVPAEL